MKEVFSLPNAFTKDKEQDSDKIVESCMALKREAEKKYNKTDYFGISNQMHGVLYVDAHGRAVSPLYTWQDRKGALPYKDGTYAEYMTRTGGYRCAPGFGLVTHFYLDKNGLVPPNAKKLCTIGDYLYMRLTGETTPCMSPTNAAALALYDIRAQRFDFEKAQLLGISPEILPEVKERADNGLFYAVGDNQASVLGSLKDPSESILINVGTGSQVSAVVDEIPTAGEVRPFFENKYLAVGAAVCGGYAVKILGEFYKSVAKAFGACADVSIHEVLGAIERKKSNLRFETTFKGTRSDSAKRAAILNIDEDNFNVSCLTAALEAGIADELYETFAPFGLSRGVAVGAGNGIKKNVHMKKCLEEKFGVQMRLTAHDEEAAFGAAMLGLISANECRSFADAREFIRYA